MCIELEAGMEEPRSIEVELRNGKKVLGDIRKSEC